MRACPLGHTLSGTRPRRTYLYDDVEPSLAKAQTTAVQRTLSSELSAGRRPFPESLQQQEGQPVLNWGLPDQLQHMVSHSGACD